MKRTLHRLALMVGLLMVAMPLAAEVFKCKDASGRVIYGEKKEIGMVCTPVTAEITVVPFVPSTRPAATPPNPKEVQREALEQKIKEQEIALAEAKKALAEQEGLRSYKEIFYQSVLDRLKPFQDKVAEIEKMLSQSRAELNQLK